MNAHPVQKSKYMCPFQYLDFSAVYIKQVERFSGKDWMRSRSGDQVCCRGMAIGTWREWAMSTNPELCPDPPSPFPESRHSGIPCESGAGVRAMLGIGFGCLAGEFFVFLYIFILKCIFYNLSYMYILFFIVGVAISYMWRRWRHVAVYDIRQRFGGRRLGGRNIRPVPRPPPAQQPLVEVDVELGEEKEGGVPPENVALDLRNECHSLFYSEVRGMNLWGMRRCWKESCQKPRLGHRLTFQHRLQFISKLLLPFLQLPNDLGPRSDGDPFLESKLPLLPPHLLLCVGT